MTRVRRPLGCGGRRRSPRYHVADRDVDLRAACRAHQSASPMCSRAISAWCRAIACCCARRTTPMVIAGYLAVIKAGGITVATMPLLRAKELVDHRRRRRRSGSRYATRGSPTRWRRPKPLARELSAHRLFRHDKLDEPRNADGQAWLREVRRLRHGERRRLPDRLHVRHHRRAEGHDAFPARRAGNLRHLFGRHVLQPNANDRFIGSAPLAFTFGLGGHVLFPFRVGATTIQLETAPPDDAAAGDREIPRHDLLHGADRLPCDAAEARSTTTSRACANASRPARRCRRRPSRPGTRRPA